MVTQRMPNVDDGPPWVVCYLAAGYVAYSDDPSEALRGWRLLYDVTQADLSEEMDVSAGVLSDYENGRRSNPGIEFVSEYVTAVVSVASGGEADGDDRAGRGGRHRISGEPEAWGHVPGQVPDAIAESVRAAWGGFESG